MDPKVFWDAVLADLQLNLSELNYKTWVAGTTAQELTEDSVEIICPTAYVRDKLQGQFYSLIKDSVSRIYKTEIDIIFKVGKSIKEKIETSEKVKEAGPLFEPIKENFFIKRETNKSGLNPKYTFENYLMGKNNQLAYAIATAIADNPGKTYNPFFLYSGVGLGKTHLMQAIGNRIIQKNPNLKVIYCTGETFTNDFIEALQKGRGAKGEYSTNRFREKYRKVDVLLIDDVQFIAGRDATQEEFFHTFNALHMAEKQIVLTSDKPPHAFKNLESRITSRFSSGIIADIQSPDIDMREAILRAKRDENKDEIPNDVIQVIASRVDTNIRELEGAYLQVLTYAKAKGIDLNRETALEALGGTIKERNINPVNVNDIMKAVCNYYSIKTADLKGARRTKELVVPRQMTMYLLYEMTQTPFMTIGQLLGGRDHTTIMHGVRKIEDEISKSTKIRQDVANIKQFLRV